MRTSLSKGSRTSIVELTVDRLTVRPLNVELYQALSTFHAFNPAPGKYYYPWLTTHTYTHVDFGAEVLAAGYYPVYRRMRFDAVGIDIAGAGAAGAKARLGIYADDDGKPSRLIMDFGEVPADSAGWQEIAIDLTLEPGRYWLAVLLNDGTVDLTRVHCPVRPLITNPPPVRGEHYYKTGVTYGPLPDPFPADGVYTGGPVLILLRVAEVF